MKEYIKILEKTTLFEGVDAESITAMLGCLGAEKKSYAKGEYVLRINQPIDRIAVLVEGKLHVQLDDYWGNRSIISVVEVAQMFGEAYATQKGGVSQSDVVAVENSTVIFFDINRILTVCSSACRFHALAVRNLFYAVSDKNVKLVNKLRIVSERTTRQKLLAFLSGEAKRQNSADIVIPFDRQQLADYLGVDRSAMSNELCKLRDEGKIIFNKNRFTLI